MGLSENKTRIGVVTNMTMIIWITTEIRCHQQCISAFLQGIDDMICYSVPMIEDQLYKAPASEKALFRVGKRRVKDN